MRQPYQRTCLSCRLVMTVDVTVRIPTPVPHRSRESPCPPHSRVGLLKGALSKSLNLINLLTTNC